MSNTHIRGLFDTIDDTKDGFVDFVEFRDWLSGSKRKTNGAYTPGLHDHSSVSGSGWGGGSGSGSGSGSGRGSSSGKKKEKREKGEKKAREEGERGERGEFTSSPPTMVEWHTNSTTGTTYGVSSSSSSSPRDRSVKAQQTQIEKKRSLALDKGVSPNTLMLRLNMKEKRKQATKAMGSPNRAGTMSFANGTGYVFFLKRGDG